MGSYEQLLEKIGSDTEEVKNESLRKLIHLAVSDQTNFRKWAKRVAESVNQCLDDMFEEDTKLLALKLLSELVTNYKLAIPKSTLELGGVIVCLSDEKVFDIVMCQIEIRKASHYLILTFVKKYEKLDEVLEGYREVAESHNISWKLIQKIIHSFESLVVFEPKCITYSEDFKTMDNFLGFVIKKVADDNSLLKKASEQALTSFVKNEYTPQILPKLNNYISQTLVNHSKAVGVQLKPPQTQDILEEVIIVNESKGPDSRIQKQVSPPKQIPMMVVVEQKPSQLRLNVPDVTVCESQSQSSLNALLDKIEGNSLWNVKREGIEEIYRLLLNGSIKQLPEVLTERVLDLTSDLNFKTCLTSMNTIFFLVSQRFGSIQAHLKPIEQILVEKMCDSKLAIRQVASKTIKELICGKSQRNILRLLMQKLANCSLLGKEEIISLVQDVYSKQQELDNTDYLMVVQEIASLLYNQNTKIKMKSIDALVKISQNTDAEECKRVLIKKLNKVYYDMYNERLRDKPTDRWEDNKNQAASYQVERSPTFAYQKPFSTKKENTTTNDKQNFFRRQEDSISINSRPENDTFFCESKTTNKTMSSTNTETICSAKTKGYSEAKSTISSNFGEFTTTLIQPTLGLHEEKVNLIVRNKYSGTEIDEDKKQKEERVGSYQYKPTLQKRPPLNEKQKVTIEEPPLVVNCKEDTLIVESRQYRFKRPNEEERPKQERKSSIKLSKPFSTKKYQERVEEDADEQEKKELTKPFTKKTSKNEPRTIDYKATQYISKEQLQPFDNPDYALKQLANDIRKEDDWNVHFDSLNNIRRILKHHPQAYPGLLNSLPTTMPEVLKLVESLRSSVAKNAMITLAQLCECLKRNMDPYLENIFLRLFRKGLDTNSFIAEEVKKCLTSLCSYCNQQKIVQILLSNFQTKHNPVKLYIIMCIERLSERYASRLQLIRQNNKVASVIGSYIADSSAEVRTNCKNMFCNIVRESPKTEVEGLFRRSTTQESYVRLKNILDKEVLAADIVVKSSSKKRIDYE